MDNCEDYDPNWWKSNKAASLERKTSQAGASLGFKPSDTFLIVTEGEVTEPTYFEQLRNLLKLSAVHIKVEPSEHSDPRHVVRAAKAIADNQIKKARKGILPVDEPAKYDHVWAVVDTDVAKRQGYWKELESLAKDKQIKLAHSTPCFEYWLLLHLTYTTKPLIDGNTAKAEVKKALADDYSTNQAVAKKAMEKLVSNWKKAIENAKKARKHHKQACTNPPADPSTEVDLLVEALGSTVRK